MECDLYHARIRPAGATTTAIRRARSSHSTTAPTFLSMRASTPNTGPDFPTVWRHPVPARIFYATAIVSVGSTNCTMSGTSSKSALAFS
jgi:hypothetical protein